MEYIGKSALITGEGKYRLLLKRYWDMEKPSLAYIMLNPSTADGAEDDPTIRKCVGFAQRLGYGSISVVNLFAYRATNPGILRRQANPVGPGNNTVIRSICTAADMVIAAWGVHGTYKDRDKQALNLLQGKEIYCLGTTKDGHPKHPLYIPYNTKPTILQLHL